MESLVILYSRFAPKENVSFHFMRKMSGQTGADLLTAEIRDTYLEGRELQMEESPLLSLLRQGLL